MMELVGGLTCTANMQPTVFWRTGLERIGTILETMKKTTCL